MSSDDADGVGVIIVDCGRSIAFLSAGHCLVELGRRWLASNRSSGSRPLGS